MFSKSLASLLVAATVTFGVTDRSLAAPMEFPAAYKINYHVTLDGEYSVAPVVMYQRTENGHGLTWPFQVDPGSSTLTDPFTKFEPIIGTFMVGVLTETSSESEPVQHLVLFSRSGSISPGASFDTSFFDTNSADSITYTEAQLIDYLLGAFAVGSNPNLDPSDLAQIAFEALLNEAGTAIGAFGEAHGRPNPALGLTGIEFDANGGIFDIVMFSSAQVIGNGTTSVTDIPEPASLAVFGLSLLVLTAARRRRA